MWSLSECGVKSDDDDSEEKLEMSSGMNGTGVGGERG